MSAPFGANTERAGGTRYSEGKPSMVATPALGMFEVGRVSAYGAEKYSLYDWYEGQSFSTLLNSAARHILRALVYGPLSRDSESGLLHVGHAAWNLLCLLSFIEEGRTEEMDDVTPWIGVTAEQVQQARQRKFVEPPADRQCQHLGFDGKRIGCVYPRCQCVRPKDQVRPE